MKNINKEEEVFLKSYNIADYERPSLAVDIVALSVGDIESNNYRKINEKKLKVLLVKRKEHPYKDTWTLIGGFVDIDQDLNYTAVQKFKEKTRIDSIYLEQLYTWGDLKRDPRGRIISVSYLALAGQNEVENSKLGSAKWFDISYEAKTKKDKEDIGDLYRLHLNNGDDNINALIKITNTNIGKNINMNIELIESENIAFDHAKMIAYALERLRNKIEYTDIAFALMPEFFSLTQLQMVYEIILGKDLSKANFRRKISHMVTETDKYKKDSGHRPSKLFRFNNNSHTI